MRWKASDDEMGGRRTGIANIGITAVFLQPGLYVGLRHRRGIKYSNAGVVVEFQNQPVPLAGSCILSGKL